MRSVGRLNPGPQSSMTRASSRGIRQNDPLVAAVPPAGEVIDPLWPLATINN